MQQTATSPKISIPRAVLIAAGVLAAAALVLAVSDRPAFAQESYEIDFPENGQGSVAVFTAQDPEGDTITWELSDGADKDLFSIDDGVLSFKSSPDFENEADADSNNVYVVEVKAKDGITANTDSWPTATVHVTVTNVNEPGVVTLSTAPRQGVALTASLSDPDDYVNRQSSFSVTWQWAWSTRATGTWTDIPSATGLGDAGASYTPGADDVGRYLRATATYADGHGGGKIARAVSQAAVDRKHYAAPSFDDDATTRRIAEDASSGDSVGAPVVANHNPNDILTYTMAAKDAGTIPTGLFTINSGTGQITVGTAAASLNHEGTSSYVADVTATDPGNNQDTTEVTIQVTDVDEPPSVPSSTTPDATDSLTGCAGVAIQYMQEGKSNAAKALCTYASTDPEGSRVDWSLSGSDAADFEITTTGQLKFKAFPDREDPQDSGSNNIYDVTIRAADRTGNTASKSVTVNVTNNEETGIVTFSRVQTSVGKTITARLTDPDGRVSRPRDDNLTSDATWTWYRCEAKADTVNSNNCTAQPGTKATYTVQSGDATKYLKVVASYTDAESVTANDTRTTAAVAVDYVVLAADTGNSNERPTFTDSVKTFSIAENTTGAVDTVGATDTNSQKVTHELSGTHASSFRIDAKTGAITVAPGVALNYESGRRSYSVSVQATDPYELKSSSPVRVTINITDLDEPPVFDDPDTRVYYDEGATAAVATYDADDPERSTITWSLTGDNNTEFSITQRGVLSFASPPVFSCTDTNNTKAVTVTAADSGGNSPSVNATVIVENVEDAGTVTLSRLVPQEDVLLGATLTDLDGLRGACTTTVVSPDAINAEVKWQWAHSADSRTWIDIAGATSISYTPDENDVGKFLRATATYRDQLSSKWEFKTASKVSSNRVRIRQYTAPVFEDSGGVKIPDGTGITRNIEENSAAGAAVGAPVTAAHNAGQVLTYSLTGDNASEFTIDSGTGQIKVGAGTSIDYESDTANAFSVTVTATDGSNMADSIAVAISATNVNEHPSVVTGNAKETIEENPGNRTVGDYNSAVATGEAETDNSIEWSLTGVDADDFEISVDGGLSFKATPDYEAATDANRNNEYRVTVVATDDQGKSASKAVTITVTNAQEAGAVTLSTVQPEAGTAVTASLADPDGVTAGTTKWQWSRSSDRSTWTTIVGATSASYTPTDAGLHLQATATYTDALGSGQTASTEAANTVQARDDDNQKPVFPNQNAAQTRTVDENTQAGSFEPQVIVAAGDENGQDSLTYTLGGTDAASFEIVRTTGEIKVGAGTVLDHESKSTYRLTVTATDPSGEKASVKVTMKVSDINEPPSLIRESFVVSGRASIDYPETQTGQVGEYTAAGSRATGISWSLAGTDAGDFRISRAGVLTFATQPNFESPADSNRDNIYELTVRARNNAGTYAIRNVTVSVINIDELGVVSLSRTSPSVGVQVRASLTDPDGGQQSVSWQWSSSLDGSTRFADISGATSDTYQPVAGDAGRYLRATASYVDAHGAGKTASLVTSSAVTTVPDSDGSVALSTTQPTVGVSVTATLTDSNTPIADLSWRWESATSTAGPWSTIVGGIASSYTPVEGDIGRYLRVTANYDDSHGDDKTASATSSNAVQRVQTLQERYDANGNGQIDRSEAIQAINDYLIAGTLTRAETLEVIRLYLIG